MKTVEICYDCKKDLTYEDYAIFDVNHDKIKNANWKSVCFNCTEIRHDRTYW